MRIEVHLTRERIVPPAPETGSSGGEVGAWVEFAGIVRGIEDGRRIAALEYEAYETMALRVMREILATLAAQHPCEAVRVIHRVGVVPVGETAIWIGAASSHRREALALVTEFMDRLKLDVPIWKRRALSAGEFAPLSPEPDPGNAGSAYPR
jgi:molybdopterin synthase catalytic subunit